MKKITSILILNILFGCFLTAQTVMECPADLTVDWKDFNQSYDYGTPTVNISQPYNLTVQTNIEALDCESEFIEIGTKEWTITYDNFSENCTQTISVRKNSFDDDGGKNR